MYFTALLLLLLLVASMLLFVWCYIRVSRSGLWCHGVGLFFLLWSLVVVGEFFFCKGFSLVLSSLSRLVWFDYSRFRMFCLGAAALYYFDFLL